MSKTNRSHNDCSFLKCAIEYLELNRRELCLYIALRVTKTIYNGFLKIIFLFSSKNRYGDATLTNNSRLKATSFAIQQAISRQIGRSQR